MGDGAVKAIVLVMTLVVISVMVGAQVSDGLADSVGAFGIIAAVLGAFGVLLLGRKCWYLLFFLPTLALNAPLGMATIAGENLAPVGFALGDAVLLLGIMGASMGYVRFRWRFLWPLDIIVLVLFCCMVASFIRYPTSVNGLDLGFGDAIGGKEYLWCIAAMLYYIAASCMPGTWEEFRRVLKYCFWLLVGSQLLYAVWRLKSGGMGLLHEHGNPAFRTLAPALIYYLYASTPLSQFFTSLKKMISICAVFGASLLNGGRESFLTICLTCSVLSFVKREFLQLLVCGVGLYAVMYSLAVTDALLVFPRGVVHVVLSVPGVPDLHNTGAEGRASEEVRKQMWTAAMDPHTGLIRDYVWGDGFQTSRSAIERGNIARLRGQRMLHSGNVAAALAAAGSFHNGLISTIHRIGAVGACIVYTLFIVGLFVLMQMARAYRHHPDFPVMMVFSLPFAGLALSYSVGTQTLVHAFAGFQYLAVVKVLYCFAREQGLLLPAFVNRAYIPMMIQEEAKSRSMSPEL